MSCKQRGILVPVFVATSFVHLSTASALPMHGAVLPESSPAADAFAAAHLALIFTVLICFGLFAWVLYRRGKAPNKEREFIEDLQEEEQQQRQQRRIEIDRKKSGAGAESDEPSDPWEKPGDWWKKD
ncbi:MAG: hypothetical protein ACI9R3_000580 [Verrucomicrobiales bacterium]|jgi:hypothetical protein